MNRARVVCSVVGMGVGLLFYFAYRSEYTVSNRLVRACTGSSHYAELRLQVRQLLPVPAVVRGCLPSALWCLIVTSFFGGWNLRLAQGTIVRVAWLCPFLNAAWELVQGVGWTDGHADGLDVLAGFAGWGCAELLFARSQPYWVSLSFHYPWRLAVVAAGFLSMGFADVWK